MKIAVKQIESFLRQPDQALSVLLYGPDRGLIRQRANSIIAKLLKDPHDPFNRVDIMEEQLVDDPARLTDELAAMSFTGDRRLVLIKEATDKSAPMITQARDQLNPMSYLIVLSDDLSPRSPLRALYESSKEMAALPCYVDEGMGLKQLITKTFADYHIRVDAACIDYLLSHLGGDRMMVMSEIEKIALYFMGEATLELEALKKLVESSNDQSIDALNRAFSGRQPAALCPLLDRLLQSGVPPVLILRSLQRELSRLADLQRLVQSGQSFDQAVKSVRPMIFFKYQNDYRQYVRCWRQDDVMRANASLLILEAESKKHHETADLMLKQALLNLIVS